MRGKQEEGKTGGVSNANRLQKCWRGKGRIRRYDEGATGGGGNTMWSNRRRGQHDVEQQEGATGMICNRRRTQRWEGIL